MEWTDEIVARLRELWAQGLSTAEIGRQLNVTKNAVVGKAHRLGLEGRPSPIRKASATKDKVGETKSQKNAISKKDESKKNKTVTQTVIESKEINAVKDESVKEKLEVRTKKPKKLEFISPKELPSYRKSNSECCWPIGDPSEKDFHFCKAPIVPGKPYCLEHVQIAYVKLKDRKNSVA